MIKENERTKGMADKALSKYFFDVALDIGKIKKLIPYRIRMKLFICQEVERGKSYRQVSEETNIPLSTTHSLSCDCRRLGYKV